MCINDKVSMGAFILIMITCVYLYKRNNTNDRWIAVVFGYIGIMQLLEYMMWIDQECKGLNQIATTIGFFHNIFQPIISIVVAYYYTNGKLPIYMYGIFIIYLTTSLPWIIEMKTNNQCSLPCKGSNIGLSWDYTNTKYQIYVWGIFCLALSIPFLAMKKYGYLYTISIIGTYIIAYFISKNRCLDTTISPPSGSWWCIMAVIPPLAALVIHK